MNNRYIYHHLGLGDHIICNALVREIVAQNEASGLDYNLSLFCKPHNHNAVSFMFRDLDKLQVIKADDARARQLMPFYSGGYIVGHEYFFRKDPSINFDEAFYKQLNIPFSSRWNKFKVIRDLDREHDLFRRAINGATNYGFNYAFVHDDPSRNLVIDRKHISPKLKIVTPYDVKTDNIFDFLTIMECATEVHCMDSSFKLMLDSINSTRQAKLFHHVNLANGVRRPDVSKSNLNWILV